jgi:hypothetical protein
MSKSERDMSKTWSGLPAPDGWSIFTSILDAHQPDTICGLHWIRLEGQKLSVMEDVTYKSDGNRWLHVSVAKPNGRMPTYEDLAVARRLFIGDRECYQVFPTQDHYVNFHNTLHLWACLDQPEGVLPRFEEQIMLNGESVLSV